MHARGNIATSRRPTVKHPRTVMTPYTPEQYNFARSLPKVELHAHLNGSIRRSTLAELAVKAGVDPSHGQIVKGDARSMSEMFCVFDVIYKSVRGASAIRRIAREVLEDAQEDGVVYFEMRTAPRSHPEASLSEQGYVEAVLQGFADYEAQCPSQAARCHASLLLSIDRRLDADNAQRVVDLALRFRDRGVVGIDLSGDPTKGSWATWLPALTRAKDAGLKVALHAGEVPDFDQEMHEMLDFCPDRFGHVCFLSKENEARLRKSKIPLELCLTSNILSCSSTIPSYADHHFATHHPHQAIALCTDDSAVFGSSLSQEHAIAMATFRLSEQDMVKMAQRALSVSFLDRNGHAYKDALARIQGFAASVGANDTSS
ncbi:unnamed protein product [Parajaminaea phylloscopi]